MTNSLAQHDHFVIPDKKDSQLAIKSSQRLATLPIVKKSITIHITGKNKVEVSTELPSTVFRLLLDILTQLGEGNAVSVIHMQKELSTQDAANILGVSRPYFVRLVEKGEIPFHKVGKHRRVYASDVLDYKAKIYADREKTLQKLTKQAQKLNMGYDDE